MLHDSAIPAATPASSALRLPQHGAPRPDVPRHQIDAATVAAPAAAAGGRPAFVLVRRGTLQVKGPDYGFRVGEGQVLACDGREPLSWAPERGVAEVLGLWPDPRTLRGPGGQAEPMAMVHACASQVAELMARLHELWSRSGGRELLGVAPAQFWLNALLAAQAEYRPLIERCHGRTAQRRRELFVRLARARALLADPACSALEVTAVARIARLSGSHFVRLFHQVFGEPPHRYRNRARMQRAREMIEGSDAPIAQVMAAVGYDSHSCFARAFRQHFGVSATALRAAGA